MNEMCKLCTERGSNGYCSNIGVQTDDADVEIMFCGEFKLIEKPTDYPTDKI